MDQNEREYQTYKIISGITVCSINGQDIYVYEPTPLQKMDGARIYGEILSDSIFLGSLNNEEMIEEMKSTDLWDSRKQGELDYLPIKIHNFKFEYYKAYVAYQHKVNIKKQLDKGKKRLRDLIDQVNIYYQYTAENIANVEKNKYLISVSSKNMDGSPLFPFPFSYEDIDNNLLEGLVFQYYQKKIYDEDIRELSQQNPWSSIWTSGKTSQELFGLPSSLLTDEQKSLISWSRTFDNVYESYDRPNDEVIGDIDLLDGWFIAQKKKSEQDRKEKDGDKLSGNKGGDVFVMVNNQKDAERVEHMNSPAAKFKKGSILSVKNKNTSDGKPIINILQKGKNK